MTEPFVFKYIPKEFEEIVGLNIEPFKRMISEPTSMPSLLFYGPKGTGKSSVARLITKKLEPVNVLKINGSSERGIDVIRDRVEAFVSSASSVPGKPKIVWVEEFDNMSQDAFKSLRSLMEAYMRNARFICTANYLNKIPEPIQSRFTVYEFGKHTVENIFPRAKQICEEEDIEVDDTVLEQLIQSCNGDLRSVVKNLQKLSLDDSRITQEKVLNMRSVLDIVYEKLFSNEWSYLRIEIPKLSPDYNDLLVELNDKFFDSDLSLTKKAKINDIIAKGQVDMAFSFDKDICASAIFYRIIVVLME
mgnify:CR=1 FL=1